MQEISLTNSESKVLVDDDLCGVLRQYNWFLWQGYATRWCRETQRNVLMHHDILGPPPEGLETDHKDRNRLNNQRHNIKHVTKAQNRQNYKRSKSGFLGVAFSESAHKWQARIKIKGVSLNLGFYHTKEEAARAYDKATKVLYGDKATLNFLNE